MVLAKKKGVMILNGFWSLVTNPEKFPALVTVMWVQLYIEWTLKCDCLDVCLEWTLVLLAFIYSGSSIQEPPLKFATPSSKESQNG